MGFCLLLCTLENLWSRSLSQPFYKPADYVEVLAQIHKELESCPPQERLNMFLLQYQVFRGLGEVKLMRRSLQGAWQEANIVHEKIIFGACLKYEKQEEELIVDLLANCGKCAKEFAPVDIASHLPFDVNVSSVRRMTNENCISQNVTFTIGDEEIVCDRQKNSEVSAVFLERDRGGKQCSENLDLRCRGRKNENGHVSVRFLLPSNVAERPERSWASPFATSTKT